MRERLRTLIGMAQGSRIPAVLEKIKALNGHASQITLNLPEKRNALSGAMVASLQDCMEQLRASTQALTCRGVLLRSNVEGMKVALYSWPLSLPRRQH